MEDYKFLNIPDSCYLGNTFFKKVFYEKNTLSTRDKALFTDVIKKIRWLYCLKPSTINIQRYVDEIRDYEEIEVMEVEVSKDHRIKRIAEIIMRTSLYPMLLVFRWQKLKQLYVAHQRINLTDSSKNTIEELIATDWLEPNDSLFKKLDINKMRFTNFYTLYSDIVDTISIYKASDLIADSSETTGEEARELLGKMNEIEQQIKSLRAKIKKEDQFNRKVELNIRIKKLEQKKNKLLGGERV